MELPKKQKTFCGNFIAFLRSTKNFKYFEKDHEAHSLNISKIINSRICGYLHAWKVLF